MARVSGALARGLVAGFVGASLLALAGCPAPRTSVRPPPGAVPTGPGGAPAHDKKPPGVVHVVERGQTLWRIARAYGMTPQYLMEANGISDPRTVKVGTELFVPGVTHVVDVPPAPSEPKETEEEASKPASPPRGIPALEPLAPSTEAVTKPAPKAEESGEPRGSGRLAWPVKGALVARFGVRDGDRHDGIDLAAPEGTPVLAAADGVVLWVGSQAGYGRLVILRHQEGLLTIYAHLADVRVASGGKLRRGDPLGSVGKSGGADRAILHFEVREGTRPKNPLLYLP